MTMEVGSLGAEPKNALAFLAEIIDLTGMDSQGIPRPQCATSHRIFISGQKRGAFSTIKRELRRRSIIEPIITQRRKINWPLLPQKPRRQCRQRLSSAVGHNFRRILAWLRECSAMFLVQLWQRLVCPIELKPAS
jgi:hypothetical protein